MRLAAMPTAEFGQAEALAVEARAFAAVEVAAPVVVKVTAAAVDTVAAAVADNIEGFGAVRTPESTSMNLRDGAV